MGQTTKSLRSLAKSFRQTKAGIQLGRTLFDPSLQTGIQPVQITNLLRQAGLPIPNEVVVGVDVAQIIMSGGAFISGIQAGASIGQLAACSASTIKATMEILSICGLLDRNSIAAMTLNMGADAAMVVSSGGTNIAADLALIADVLSAALMPPDERPQVTQMLDKLNRQAAVSWWKDRQKLQESARLQLQKDFMEKKISIFEYIGERAIQTGDSFLNYFPEYKVFIAPVLMKQCFVSKGDANYGGFLFVGRKTANLERELCFDFETALVDKRFMQQVFVRKYINDPFAPYVVISSMNKSQVARYGYPPKSGLKRNRDVVYPRISLAQLSILSSITRKFDRIDDNFDVTKYLREMRLTPKDLGSSVIFDNTKEGAQYLEPISIPTGISINGVEQIQTLVKAQNQAFIDEYTRRSAEPLDDAGDIEGLLKFPRIRELLKEWGILPYIPDTAWKDSVRRATHEGTTSIYRNIYPIAEPNSIVDYRNIQNFFSVLSVIDYIQKDPFFSDGSADLDYMKKLFPVLTDLQEWFSEISFLSQARYLNSWAQDNIAFYFGTEAAKVEYKVKPSGLAYVQPKR